MLLMSSNSSSFSSSSSTTLFMQEEAGMEEVEQMIDVVNKETMIVKEFEEDDDGEIGLALLRRKRKVVLGNGNDPVAEVAEVDQEKDGREHQKNVYFDQEQGTEIVKDFSVRDQWNMDNEGEKDGEEEEEDSSTFSRTSDHGQVGMYLENSEDEIQPTFPFSPESSHVNGLNASVNVSGQTKPIESTKKVQEVDVERVLAEQDTHDLFCPNCKSCITKRVILRKRKRTIRETIEERPEKIQTVQLELPAAAAAAATATTEAQDTEVFRCLSCLSFFIPTEGGFKLFNPFGKKEESAAQQLEQSENTSWFFSLFGSTSKKKVNDPDAENKVQQGRTGEVIKDPGPSKPVSADEKAELITHAGQETPVLLTSRDVSQVITVENFQEEVEGHYEDGEECDSSEISRPDDIVQSEDSKNINILNPYLFRMKMPRQKITDVMSEPHVLDTKEETVVFENLPPENLKVVFSEESKVDTTRTKDDIIQSLEKSKTSIFNPYLFRMKKPRNLKNNKGDDVVPPHQDILLPETGDIQNLDYSHGAAAESTSSPTDVTIQIPPGISALNEPLIIHIQQNTQEPGRRQEWDVLKAIVYGGLIESITSLSVVLSAVGADASTLTIVALGMANLLGGLLLLINNLMELNNEEYESLEMNDERASRYWKLLGRRNHVKLHTFVALLTYIIVGILPPAIYGFSFLKSDNKEYKLIAIAVSSLICVVLLAIGKAHVQRPPKPYVKTLSYYIVLGFLASGISFVAGVWIQKLLLMLGVFDSGGEVAPSPPSLQLLQLDSLHSAWKGF